MVETRTGSVFGADEAGSSSNRQAESPSTQLSGAASRTQQEQGSADNGAGSSTSGAAPRELMPVAPTDHDPKARWQEYAHQLVEYTRRQEAKQKEETVRLQAERDVAIRQSIMQTTMAPGASGAAKLTPAKPIIKTQGHPPDTYSGGSYIKFDSYIIEMEHQFVLNNVHDRSDMDAQKISYAVTFLHETPKHSWLAVVRDGTASTSTWGDFKAFLAIRSQNSATFSKDTYARWQKAQQRTNQTAADYIAYLDRQASYLPDNLKPNEHMQMLRLSLSLVPDLQADLATETPYPTTYQDMRKRVLILEENSRAKRQILHKPSGSGSGMGRSQGKKRARHERSDDDDDNNEHEDRPAQGRKRGQRGGYRGRSRGGRSRSTGNYKARGGAASSPATGANKAKEADSKQRDEREQKGQCYTCGSSDHFARDCIQSKNV